MSRASFRNVLRSRLLAWASIFGCVHKFEGKTCCACDTWYGLVVDAHVPTDTHTQTYTGSCQLLPDPPLGRGHSASSVTPLTPDSTHTHTHARTHTHAHTHTHTHTACHLLSSISVRDRCMLSHTENTHTEDSIHLTTKAFNTFKNSISKIATCLREDGPSERERWAEGKKKKEKERKSPWTRDTVTNLCPAMDESFRSVRREKEQPWNWNQ